MKSFLQDLPLHPKIVVLTGAGISAESGISTFRDSGGLWENYKIEEVATPEAWRANPSLVQSFYNARRKQLFEVSPNDAHYALGELAQYFDVEIITQNVDDLHERAGSKKVLHLHGELRKARSVVNPQEIYELESWELSDKDVCQKGFPLRPHIVWFGEAVPMMERAIEITQKADLFLVIGTSLHVYPAAGLLHDVPFGIPIVVIDPSDMELSQYNKIMHIREKASVGVGKVVSTLLG